MDRTIKVTGFHLKSHVERKVIENKLRFLFLGVGQVEQVSLSEDRNSARVQFYHRDALNFVSKQEWRLGSAHLRVQPFVPPSDDQDDARPNPVQLSCKPELSVNTHTPQKYSLLSYCDNRNKFWVDIPHETFTVVSCARRKRKRCCNLDLQHAASFQQNSKRKKRKTKPGKKKKNAQLESFAPLPFGITCISQDKAQALEPSEKENQRTSVREVFVKGTTTVATTIQWTATAADVREVVSAASKVPENLLHVTVDGRTLTDEVVLGMSQGFTLHYSVRGKGGMQKGDEGGEEAGLDNQTNCLKKKEELFQAVKEEGNLYFGKGEFEKAVKFYTQCLSIFADRATVYTNRALCFLRLDQAVEAERDCTAALHLESTNIKALYQRGLARKMQANYRGALEDQLEVLRSQDSEPNARREVDLLKKLYKPEFRRTIPTGKHSTTNKEPKNSNSNRTKATLHETPKTPADVVRKKTLSADATGQGIPSTAAATEQERPSPSATTCEKTTVNAAEQEKLCAAVTKHERPSAAATHFERPTMDDKKHERPTAEQERLTVDATEQEKPSAEHKRPSIDAAELEQPSATATKHGKPCVAATKHGKPPAEHGKPTIDAAEQEQPSAAATEQENTSAEHERPSIDAAEQEQPSAAVTLKQERPSAAATEHERPSVAAIEHERPSAAATEQEQPSAAATNRERPSIDDPNNVRPSAATTDHASPQSLNDTGCERIPNADAESLPSASATEHGTTPSAEHETPLSTDATEHKIALSADTRGNETLPSATEHQIPLSRDALTAPSLEDATEHETALQETPSPRNVEHETSPNSRMGAKTSITRDANLNEVHAWLVRTCGLSEDNLEDFDVMDGKTLFSYTEFESLIEDIGLNYGLARKIIFLRDNRPCQSKMLQWNVDEVISFVRRTLNKPDLDLPLFEQKGIDGVVFKSFTDAGELKRDLGLSGLHARRVFEEKKEFLKNESNGMFSLEQTAYDVDMVADDIKVSALAKDNSQTKTPWLNVHDSHQTYEKTVLTEVLTGRPGDLKKIFLQDTLHLQHLSVPKDLKDKSVKNVSLKILQIAEQNPSVLDQNFVFCIACGSDVTKDSFPLLWNSIKAHVHLWLELVPVHLKGKLKIENDKVIHNGNVVAFSKIPTTSQVNIGDVERKGIKLCSRDCTWILLVDRRILTENVPGYACNLGTQKNVLKYFFGFDKARKYYVFDVASSTCSFESTQLRNTQSGLLERCFLQLKDGAAASAETPQTCNTDEKNEHLKQEKMPKESYPDEVLASVAPKTTRPRKRLPLVLPRKFKQDPKTCKYLKGQLDIHETADGFILPSTELKHYEREDAPLKETFLLKSLEFICGCMNSRRNGTIYFGVPEKDTQYQQFEYGEIVGVSLQEHERNEYYECFYRFLEKCFSKKSKIVKECVYGPYFVRIKTLQTESERFVIEVDVEPAADTCVENYFEFDPGHINKNSKEKKGVYWRGIDGKSVQTRRLSSSATEKYKDELPAIVKKRKEEEKKWEGNMETRTNDGAKKLKAFMKECHECDTSVDPILLISKPTEVVKADMDACLKFVKRIPWVAVLDFDYQSSEEHGLLHLQTSSPSVKNVLPIPVKTFEKKEVEKQKVELKTSLQTLWFLANGSSGDSAFDHLEHNDWLKQYYPFVRNAVVFLQNPCVISKQRHHILILVSAEMEEDIIKTADDMASDPNIGLDSAFFVFDEERTQELFISKSIFGEDIKTQSCTMPWQDVQRIVNGVLQFDRKHDHKQVNTAGDTPAEIPPHQWLKWKDLSILTADECEEIDPTLELSKAEDEEIRFYKGGEVSWLNFYFPNHVMPRSSMEAIEEEILKLAYKNCTDTPTVIIHHMPGTGGTTLAKHLLWKRRKSFKCAVIDRISHNTFSQVCEFWESEEILDQQKWKPLILVSDNNTTDESDISESELCDKIYKHQKQAGLSKPMAILIICHRTAVHVRHGISGYSLKQQLIDGKERLWMEDTYKRLEGEKVPSDLNSFLGFLCLRHEFKQRKLEEIITPYLYDETLSKKERELIIYIALIMKYFPPSLGRPGIPVSSCDMFMDNMKHTWDKKVLGIANVILVREYDRGINKKVVKIANRLVAEVILSVVMQRDSQKLPDLVIDCLNSSLVADLDECEYDHSSWTIKILRSMLIDRLTETGTKRHMSPLILEVQSDSLDKAVEILELGYQRLGGEVFYQQLARLYTKEVLFEKAVTCAQKAVDLSRTDNEEFAHTLGFVYLRYFEHLKKSKEASFEVACHKNELEKAIKSFNSLTNAQNSADAITKSYACCDKIKVINSLLDYIINKVLSGKDYGKFGRFLVAEGYHMDNFDKYSDLKDILKEILETGTEALKYMYYFGFSYKHRDRMGFAIRNRSKFPVSYTKEECVKQFKTLARTIAIVVTAPMPDDELPMSVQLKRFRVENLKLTGSFFESQLDFVARFHHAKPPIVKNQQQCREQLKKIKANLDEILTGSYTPEDMDNYITVCLAMEMLGIEQEFTQKRLDIYNFCNRIISSGDGDEARTMRAHLYRMLVCWPTWKESAVFSTYQFLQSFHNRPTFLTCREGPLTPRAHFFIASSKSKFHVCHWTEIFEQKKQKKTGQAAHVFHHPLEDIDEEDGEEEEHDTEELVNVVMHQKLQSFRGIHKVSADGGKGTVELDMAVYSRKLPKTVTIRAVKAGKKVCVDADVEFFLGFSLQGPVAYVYKHTTREPHR